MQHASFAVPDQLVRANLSTKILSLDNSRATWYGRLIEHIDLSHLVEMANESTSIDPSGNTYVASIPEWETSAPYETLSNLFGQYPIEIGYCNGPNQTINGMEYHKTPELFIAVTDCVQFLCRPECLHDFATCNSYDAEAFFFPKGSAFLLHPCILHLAPCSVHATGFKSIIILPKETNLPLPASHVPSDEDPEQKLLFKVNKWMIAHPTRLQLIKQGVYPGLTGENRRIVPIGDS